MKRNYFKSLAAVLIVCIAALSACGKKADSSNDANVAADSANVVKDDTKTLMAKFQAVYLNSNGAIYVFNDFDGNAYEFYETESLGKGMDEFMQGIKPNVVDPKFEKIVFEVNYNTQPKQFYNGATGESETRDVLAIVEIKQVDITDAELQKSKTIFTSDLIKSIVASGTEPFWDIKFKETHAEYNDPNGVEKIFYRKDNNDSSKPKLSEVLKQVNNNTVEILCTMKNVPGKIVIKKQNCSDGMSDESYAYSVEFIREKMDTYMGCGRVE